MRVAKVRDGEKVVLDDRGGVWVKTGVNDQGKSVLRCFFGPTDVFGKDIEVEPFAYCFVIFDDQKTEPVAPPVVHSGVLKVKVLDEDTQELIQEFVGLPTSQVTALSSVETILLTPPGKKSAVVYHVTEFAYDMDEKTLCVMVIPERNGE
jgi:hypothetical protein